MTLPDVSTIATVGAGLIGSQVARLAVRAGYDVVVSNSRSPETLTDLVDELGPRARAATAEEAAAAGDLVVVTVPLHRYRDVPVTPLESKIVIDTNNYYPERDGRIDELDRGADTSAGLLQKHLPGSRVVKGFNHIRAAELTTDGAPSGTDGRRALVVASDDEAAKASVTALFDEFGFDTVDAGSLADSWRIEPGTPGYGPRADADRLRAHLEAAVRRG